MCQQLRFRIGVKHKKQKLVILKVQLLGFKCFSKHTVYIQKITHFNTHSQQHLTPFKRFSVTNWLKLLNIVMLL